MSQNININVNCADKKGKIKIMHAVNNGPVYNENNPSDSNLQLFRDAEIPYIRTHDSSFSSWYGAEHSVDITGIFPDFDKDPYDCSSYDFYYTDEYMKLILKGGGKPFFRLGQRIEHQKKKYGSLPPKDFHKWAIICEHIIRHYNYGWNDGYFMNIEYWEIWNEPDLPDNLDPFYRTTWGGTRDEFYRLYNITANHLKKQFPELKIGGPSAGNGTYDWFEEFLDKIETPPDFVSWHFYNNNPAPIMERAHYVRQQLDKRGFYNTESILNEWNYIVDCCCWSGEKWITSIIREKSMYGAAFIAAMMCASHKNDIDMLMYYDARMSGMNGMFDGLHYNKPLKGYYPFKAFNMLYKAGTEIYSQSEKDYYSLAASGNGETYIMIVRYGDNLDDETVKLKIDNIGNVKAEYYLLDENHNFDKVKVERYTGSSVAVYFKIQQYSMLLVKLIEENK